MTNIKIEGLDKLQKGLSQFPKEIEKNIGQAGNEAAERIIFQTEGLKKYPPTTAANQPPAPYYIRGRGLETARGNLGNSERAGTQFYTRVSGLEVYIGNRASYAQYLFDSEKQSKALAGIGWRKLLEVTQEKLEQVKDIYQKWVNHTITSLGL